MALARRLMRLATTIVVPSDYLVDVFARFGLRATRIHNVAETQSLPYRNRLRPQPVFLHNRGLAPEYNPACTLRAFAIVQQRYRNARLIMAHDGPLRPALEALARSLGLRQTQFVGSVSSARMAALYDSADIYLMSPTPTTCRSRCWNVSRLGLPVVASDAGGVPNMVQDQVNGLLFAPDDHQAMAACAIRLLEGARPGIPSRSQCPRPVRQVRVGGNRSAMACVIWSPGLPADEFGVDRLHASRGCSDRKLLGRATRFCPQLLAQYAEVH